MSIDNIISPKDAVQSRKDAPEGSLRVGREDLEENARIKRENPKDYVPMIKEDMGDYETSSEWSNSYPATDDEFTVKLTWTRLQERMAIFPVEQKRLPRRQPPGMCLGHLIQNETAWRRDNGRRKRKINFRQVWGVPEDGNLRIHH